MTTAPAGDGAILSRLAGQRATWIEIDLDALAANLRAVATACGGLPVWAVVKADAYGHGATHCARTLVAAGAAGLVVALPEEGITLRRAGLEEVPILLSGPLPCGGAGPLITHDLIASISSVADLHALEAAAHAASKAAAYHLELDTGMTRLGLSPADLGTFLEATARAPSCRLAGVMSHLAPIKDASGPVARRQLDLLVEATRRIRRKLGVDVPVHLASSPALCSFPDAYLEAVRPGLLLYGIRPDPGLAGPPGLRPVLSLRAVVALVREVPPGTAIGYEGKYTTVDNVRVALLAAGYADGLAPGLAGRAEALLGGRRFPYRGAVNMDLAQLVLQRDVQVEAGAIATLIGQDGDERITVEELAARTGRSAYQWLTGLGARVPRVYTVDGAPHTVQVPLGSSQG